MARLRSLTPRVWSRHAPRACRWRAVRHNFVRTRRWVSRRRHPPFSASGKMVGYGCA